MHIRLIAIAAILFSIVGAASGAHLSSYPRLDSGSVRPVVIVASVRPGKELPELEECTKRDVICLHSPFWFRANILESVYGNPPGRNLEVATLSHYGMEAYTSTADPQLMLLLLDGDKIVMPLYASADVVRRNDGTLFLLAYHPDQPWWLPCSVSALREELAENRFPRSLAIPRDQFKWTGVDDHPELFTIYPDKAFPRYGIRISQLRSHLGEIEPDASLFECKKDP